MVIPCRLPNGAGDRRRGYPVRLPRYAMSPERRYSEDEIASIFEQAARVDAERRPSHSEGLTLAELQEVGSQSGISSEAIAQAAALVDTRRTTPPPARFLSLPISVARTVDLPGTLSERDWEDLVVDMRDTFHAPGEIRRDGALRTWRNGNLHVTLEPGEHRDRLRFRTLKGAAREVLLSGGIMLVVGMIMFVSMLIGSGFQLVDDQIIALLMMLIGVGLGGGTAWSVARWREERAAQFDEAADRAAQRLLDRAALRDDALGDLERGRTPDKVQSAVPAPEIELEEEPMPEPSSQRSGTLSRNPGHVR